jgi:hypothetical protein
LLSRPDVAKDNWKLSGKGAGALWSLYAAAIDDRIQDCTCERGLVSYALLARTDRYLHNASIFVLDVLKHFDLPHVAAAVANRRLSLIAPVDAMKVPVDPAVARNAYRATFTAYQAAGVDGQFTIA